MNVTMKSINHHVEGRDFMTDLDLLVYFGTVICWMGKMIPWDEYGH